MDAPPRVLSRGASRHSHRDQVRERIRRSQSKNADASFFFAPNTAGIGIVQNIVHKTQIILHF